MEKHLTYNIQIEIDEDGKYVVSVPALKGCFTQGRNFGEALKMAQDAILGFVTSLSRRGKRIPVERTRTSPFVVSVNIPKVLV